MNPTAAKATTDDDAHLSWDVRLQRRLASAARVLEFRDIQALADEERKKVAPSTTRALVEELVAVGGLRRVNAGLYLNRRTTPPAENVEAAQHVRTGSHISLHSVLGPVGALNNTPSVVFAVVPVAPGQRANLGAVPPRPKDDDEQSKKLFASWGVHFRFFALDERFFPKSLAEAKDVLVIGARCPTFTPEAAFLHWLHLSQQHRSPLTPPPVEDITFLPAGVSQANKGLRRDRLEALAARWEMSAALSQWLSRYDHRHTNDDEHEDQHQVLVAPVKARRPRP